MTCRDLVGAPLASHADFSRFALSSCVALALLAGVRWSAAAASAQFVVQGSTIIGPVHGRNVSLNVVDFWRFPKGGSPKRQLVRHGVSFYGVALSDGK